MSNDIQPPSAHLRSILEKVILRKAAKLAGKENLSLEELTAWEEQLPEVSPEERKRLRGILEEAIDEAITELRAKRDRHVN